MSSPDRISDGKLVRGEGSDQLQFRKTQTKEKILEDGCSLVGGLTRPHPGARPGVRPRQDPEHGPSPLWPEISKNLWKRPKSSDVMKHTRNDEPVAPIYSLLITKQ